MTLDTGVAGIVTPTSPPDAPAYAIPAGLSLRTVVGIAGVVGVGGPLLAVLVVGWAASPVLALAAGLAVCLLLVMALVAGGWWLARRVEAVAATAEALQAERQGSADDDLGAAPPLVLEPHELASLRQAVGRLGARLHRQRTEHAEARSALAERARRLEAVQAVTNDIVHELDLTRLLETIIARAAQLVGGDSGSMSLWEPESELLVMRTLYRLDPWMLTQQLKLGEATGGLAALRREGVIVNEYRTWPGANWQVIERTSIAAVLAEPILFQDQLIGVLLIYHEQPERRFTTEDQETVRMFAAEAALAIRNASLYQFEAEAREIARAAEQEKGEFLATMSHEIRAPMHNVVSVASQLLETPLDDDQRASVETIRNSSAALLTIIDSALDFSKLEAGRLAIAPYPFDLRASIDTVVTLLAPRAAERGLLLTYRVDASVPDTTLGDAARVRHILLSLVDNAIKFTERGSVVVEVTGSEAADPASDTGMVIIAVHDTGIGISPEALAGLFERFTQVDTVAARTYGGTGLGLAISRQLVELMGGQIHVESHEGKGSTFWFTLPLKPAGATAVQDTPASEHASLSVPPASAPPVSAPPAAVGAGLAVLPRAVAVRILVAEDDVIAQRMVVQQLQQRGFLVDAVADGQAALEAVAANAYGLVLMDCQMPDVDGYAAAAEIRQREAVAVAGARRLPIVALTISAWATVREHCLAAGMDAHLTKPVDAQELEALLERWLPPGEPRPDDHREPRLNGYRALDHTVPPTLAPGLPPILDPAGLPGAGSTLSPQYHEIVALFLQETPRRIEALRAAAALADRAQVARVAHLLAGSASILGASRLAAASAALEVMAREAHAPPNGNAQRGAASAPALALAIEGVRHELRQLESTISRLTADH